MPIDILEIYNNIISPNRGDSSLINPESDSDYGVSFCFVSIISMNIRLRLN